MSEMSVALKGNDAKLNPNIKCHLTQYSLIIL